jgi:hypothetical protein
MLFTKKIKFVSVVILCVLAVSCRKKATPVQNNGIPYVPVNLVIYPNDPLNIKIQTPGGWLYFNGGVAGIIVYRKSPSEFVALERASTYSPDNFDARVKVQADAFTLRDTISGSKWQIYDGAVISGPATLPLRIYNNTYDQSAGVLRITN